MQEDDNGIVWMTVKQFATVAKVSTQAVYKRLATDFQPYCKEMNGRKYINSDALVFFGVDNCLQLVATEVGNDCQLVATKVGNGCQPVATEVGNGCQPVATVEAAAIDVLQEMISEKETTIGELKTELMQLRDELKKSEQYHRERDVLQAQLDCERAKSAAEIRAVSAERDRLIETVRGLTAAIQADAAARALNAKESQSALETVVDNQSEDKPTAKRGWLQKIFKRKKS